MYRLTAAVILGCVSLNTFAATHTTHDSHGVNDVAQFANAQIAKEIHVDQCWVRLLPNTVPSAGYFILHNESTKAIELVAALTPNYEHTMLHESLEVDGMTQMRMTGPLKIEAEQALHFRPGGLHAMFEAPTAALNVGDIMPLELLLSTGEKVVTDCKVNPANARGFD